MTQQVASQDVIARLKKLQSAGQLPREARKPVEMLVKRLSSPVRITLLGPPGAGKSTLRDILAGATVVPEGRTIPTTLLRFGDREVIAATLGDRSVRTVEGLDFATLQDLPLAFVEVEAPLDGLRDISLLEVVTDGSARDLAAATKWAAGRTDIAIWVTTEFGPEERATWAKVPDEMKDHAYLVLNQIDRLRPDERASRLAQLNEFAAQTFHAFFAISAVSDQTAGQKGGVSNEGGRGPLLKALRRHVELANQADLDGALLVLNRFETPEEPKKRPQAKASADQGPQAAATTPDAPSAQALRVEEIASQDDSQGDAACGDARTAALDSLRSCANGILSDWSNPKARNSEMVLDHCVETIEDLTVTLPDGDRLYDPVQQASDLIVLLHLEKSDTAAENAVTALLQLKRDFEVALAA